MQHGDVPAGKEGVLAFFAEIALQLQGDVKLIRAEQALDVVSSTGEKLGTHRVDHVLEVNGVKKYREMKEWEDVDKIPSRLASNVKGRMDEEGDLKGGQFFLNIVHLTQKGAHKDLSKVDIEWPFVKGNPATIVDELVKNIRKDRSSLKMIADASGDRNLADILKSGTTDELRDFVNVELRDLLETSNR